MAAGKLFDQEYLRRLQRLGLQAKRLATVAGSAGQRRGQRLGDGLEFADHRAYAPGDDLRFLDWPYYARMERLLLRLFHEHSEGAVQILLDRSRSMSLGVVCKFDYARRAAGALAYVAMASLDRVRIWPFDRQLGEPFQTGRNRRQILEVLDFLETVECGQRTSLEEASRQFATRNRDPGTIIVISDVMDVAEELSDALTALRRPRNEVVLLQIVDQADATPEPVGTAQLSCAETGERMTVNVNEAVAASYAARWREFVRGVERTCLSRGAVHIEAPTTAPFERLVLTTCQRAGVLQY